MARSSAQSECGELSTGTKTSLYGMTPPSAVMGSLKRFRIAGLLCLPSEEEMRDDDRASAPINSRAHTFHFAEASFRHRARESLFGVAHAVRVCSCSSRRGLPLAARDMNRG